MAPRTIYLVSLRPNPRQRAHFAIWVPTAADPQVGSLINVVGAPVVGFLHEFKRGYDPTKTIQSCDMWPLGQVDSSHIVDFPIAGRVVIERNSRGDLEIAATQVRPPGISANFMAPVNDTTNKRCQEWTMEYVRHLVAKGYIAAEAIQIVQSHRDPPSFGIGLRPIPG